MTGPHTRVIQSGQGLIIDNNDCLLFFFFEMRFLRSERGWHVNGWSSSVDAEVADT